MELSVYVVCLYDRVGNFIFVFLCLLGIRPHSPWPSKNRQLKAVMYHRRLKDSNCLFVFGLPRTPIATYPYGFLASQESTPAHPKGSLAPSPIAIPPGDLLQRQPHILAHSMGSHAPSPIATCRYLISSD